MLLFNAVIYGWVLETLIVAVLLAQKSLLDHVHRVVVALRENGVPAGREAVAMIVGRDVARMERSDIARAAVESSAENFSDGTIAPAFWYLVCGLPGLLVYKIVNTADSMIGHRNDTYLQFGFAAARLDDVLNYIPARLSAALIALVAPLQGGSTFDTAATIARDASSHASPNAGWPETAVAGALDIALGGPRSYGDERLHAPWLNGEGEHDISGTHIEAATNLIETAWFAALIALAATQIFAIL
jgi:adenosylcobinamide-phosphate synthase